MKLFVRNIPFKFTDENLKQLFETVGTVVSANIIFDKFTQRSRGFGFVVMGSTEEGEQAIEKLSGHSVEGMSLAVEKAQDKKERTGPRPGGGERREYRPDRGGERREFSRDRRDSRGSSSGKDWNRR